MKKCKIEERLKIIENKVIDIETMLADSIEIETMLAGSIEYNDRNTRESNKEDLHYDSLSHDEKFEYLMRESTRHPIKEEE